MRPLHAAAMAAGSRKCWTGVGVALALAGASWGAAAGPFDNLFGPAVDPPASAAAEPLTDPPVHRSGNGELNVTLEARPTPVKLGPYVINGAAYDGAYGGPVLRLKPGDTLHLRLVNHLPQATNIHF